MKRILLVILLALCALPVFAQTPAQLVITWKAPLANTDGSTPASVSGYNLYIEPTDAALTALPTVTGGTPICPPAGPFIGCGISLGNVLTYTTVGLPTGTYSVAATAYFCTSASSCTESIQSVHMSGPVGTATTPPVNPTGPVTPNPPTNLAHK